MPYDLAGLTLSAMTRLGADTFRNASMNLKVALLPFVDRPVFGIPNYEQH